MVAKSKAQLMKESRQRRKDADLVRREYWATPENHKVLADTLCNLTNKDNQVMSIEDKHELEKLNNDLRCFGTSLMRDGKHIPPNQAYEALYESLISSIKELLMRSDSFNNYAYSRRDLQKLIEDN